MALLAAFLVRELRRLAMAVTGDERLAEGTAWLVGLSPPLIHFAGLIFTEIPAALLLAIGLRAVVFGRGSRALLVGALCASALPWFNVRYAILSAGIVGLLGWRLGREARLAPPTAARLRGFFTPVLILVGSALALLFYHFELWGFFDPRRVYGRRREFSLDILPEGLPGLFFDQEFGLFVYAPIFVLSIVGFARLWRRERALTLAAAFAVLGVIATASVWPMWRGGFNPPSRFLVPLLSVLASCLALSLQRGIRPATALLAGWSLWCGLGGALNIETIHRDRDGVAPFFRTEAGAREWTSALPSFVLPEDRPTRALAWPFALLLAMAAIPIMRSDSRVLGTIPRKRDTLAAVSAFMAVAIFTDRVSPRVRAPERDATRLVGSPSILLPSLRFESASTGEWPLDLFYEPHRNPGGFQIARAVSLSEGAYELSLVTRDAREGRVAPSLIVADHRTQRSTRQLMRVAAEALIVSFTVATSGEFDLRLEGGEPCLISRARILRN
jgi:hypothetical protein